MESRREQRSKFTLATQVSLLNDDADKHEELHADEEADRKGLQRLVFGSVLAVAGGIVLEAVRLFVGG